MAYPRYFEEVHVKPEELTATMAEFRTEDALANMVAQTQEHSAPKS